MTPNKRIRRFDELIGMEGAYEIFRSRGFEALAKLLKTAGIEHKGTLGESQGAGPRSTDDPATMIDESLLIADDTARLEAKRAKLNVPAPVHLALVTLLGKDTLEDVYNIAFAHEPAPVKALLDEERALMIEMELLKLGIPESVLAALANKFGTSAPRILENVRDMLVFGDVRPKAYKKTVEIQVKDPIFGWVKPPT